MNRIMRIGIFTAVGLFAIVAFSIYVNDHPYWYRNCNEVKINVDDATGLRRKSPVKTLGLEIGYINAHATGTLAGDTTEAQATAEVYGDKIPVSSLKGHLGHALGACATLELAATVEVLQQGWIPPTLNLEDLDPTCNGINHVIGSGITVKVRAAVSNTVAFGGVNASLVLEAFND